MEQDLDIPFASQRRISQLEQNSQTATERQAGRQAFQAEIELFRKRWIIRKIRWIEDLKLFSLLSSLEVRCHG